MTCLQASAENELLDALASATTPEERLVGDWTKFTSRPDQGSTPDLFGLWLRRVANNETERAAKILNSRGLSLTSFREGFQSVTRIRTAEPPNWALDAVAMLHLVARPTDQDSGPSLGELFGEHVPSWLNPEQSWPLYPGFYGWMKSALADINSWIGRSSLAFDKNACQPLVFDLISRLLSVCGRYLVVKNADSADLFLQNPLDTWLWIWKEKPVMARLMAVAWRQWKVSTEELINRLSQDFAIHIGIDTVVKSVTPSQGDHHGGGRAVAVVILKNNRSFYYKPRKDGLKSVLKELLEATGLEYAPSAIRLPEMIECDTHQWSSEVECCDASDIPLYFWRAGVLLRLMQATGATDLHHENFVPTGDQAVLVDLETVISPNIGFKSYPQPSQAQTKTWLFDTPGPTSFLSSPVVGQPGRCCPDLGALAGPTTMPTPYKVPTLTKAYDAPRIVSARQQLSNGTALPRRSGCPVSLFGYEKDLIAGFEFAHNAIVNAPEAPERLPMATAMVRYVARPTSLYARLLQESLDPSVLHDGLARELVLEGLWRSFGSCPPQLIKAEQEALRELDVPLFSIPCQGTNLHTDRGQVLADVMEASPYAELKRRWTAVAMRSDHRADVEAALFAMSPQVITSQRDPTQRGVSHSSIETVAMQLISAGEVLIDRTIGSPDGDLGWVGLDYDPARYLWRHRRLQPGLLGDAGIALVLLVATTVCHDTPKEWASIARQVLISAATRSMTIQRGTDSLCAAPGVLACIALAAQITNDLTLELKTQELVPVAIRQAFEAASTGYSIGPSAVAAIACSHVPSGLVGIKDYIASMISVQSRAEPADEPPHNWSLALPTRRLGGDYALTILGHNIELPCQARGAGDAALWAHIKDIAEDYWRIHWTPDAPVPALLDCAEVARSAERACMQGPWKERMLAAGVALVERKQATGRWFSDLVAPDTHFLSAIHGIGAIVLLGSALMASKKEYSGGYDVRKVPILRIMS